MLSHSINFPFSMDPVSLADDESPSMPVQQALALSMDPFSATDGSEQVGINMGLDDDDDDAAVQFHPSTSGTSPPAADDTTQSVPKKLGTDDVAVRVTLIGILVP
jgi:hypothetical protein